MVGVFALAYGEFGLLVLLASAGLASTLPAIAVAVVPLAYVAVTLG